jgi:hypothetical protein
MKIDWINSWKSGRKSNIFEVTLRLGQLTILEIYINPDVNEHRFMVLNFGFELWKEK